MAYVEAGKNILNEFYQGNGFLRPIGWPSVLSIIFSVTGISNIVALKASFVLGVLTIPAVFLFVNNLIKNQKISLLASFIFAMFPKHIFWSNTAETNVASLFFIIITLYFSTLFYKNKKNKLLYLALTSLSLTTFFRGENILLIIPFLLGIFLFIKKKLIHFKKEKLAYLLYFVLSLPNYIITIYWYSSAPDLDPLKEGMIFSVFAKYFKYIFYEQFFRTETMFLYFILLLLGAIGLYFILCHNIRKGIFLSAFVIFFYLFNSIICKTNINLGGISRFSLIFMPFIATLAAYGSFYIYKNIKKKLPVKSIIYFVIPVFIIIVSILYTIEVQELYNRLDNKYRILATEAPSKILKDNLSNYTFIIPHQKVLAPLDNKMITLTELYKGHHIQKKYNYLFYEGYYCHSLNQTLYGLKINKTTFELCDWIKKKYNLTIFKKYKEKNITYKIYKFN
ncbi:MAG: ArnT family glycosyltransferase [Nanobdellota archaeon]